MKFITFRAFSTTMIALIFVKRIFHISYRTNRVAFVHKCFKKNFVFFIGHIVTFFFSDATSIEILSKCKINLKFANIMGYSPHKCLGDIFCNKYFDR